MDKNIINDEVIRDAHLDTLIRLAYKQAELDEIQKLVAGEADPLPEELEPLKIKAYIAFEKKRERMERREKRAARTAGLKRSIPRIVNIAAVFMIVICISVPFAVARVDFLRDKMMEMLIRFEEEYSNIKLEMSAEKALEVPDDWAGMYYPTYIPDGYWLKWHGTLFKQVVFKNEQGKEISFRECTENIQFNIDSEEVDGSKLEINDEIGYTAIKNGKVIIVWKNGDRYFILSTEETEEIAIRIAEKVQIIPK